MNELIKVRWALEQKEHMEAWLADMLAKGWKPKRFRYVLLGTLLNIVFEETAPRRVRCCLYDIKYEDDEAIFLEAGWQIVCRNGLSVVFVHENPQAPLPLLDMKLYTKRRIFKTTCNLLYLFSLIYCSRVEEADMRQPFLYVTTLFLFALPLLFDVKSTRKGNNMIRIGKNLLYAIVFSAIVYLLLELLISTFYVLF